MAVTSEANLFDYLKPDEVATLRDLARAVEAADGEVRRIAAKAEEVDRTLVALASRRRSNAINAAARALGEVPPLPDAEAAPVDRSELEEQAEGLRERLRAAEDGLKRARGALRAAITDLVRLVCNERLAPEYVNLAGQLANVFAMLLGAEDLMLSLVSSTGDYGKVRHVADRGHWGKLYLPGSLELPAVAKVSHEEWALPVVLSGESALQGGVSQAALARFKDAFAAAVGRWPFDGGIR